jgi:hypothetical protein
MADEAAKKEEAKPEVKPSESSNAPAPTAAATKAADPQPSPEKPKEEKPAAGGDSGKNGHKLVEEALEREGKLKAENERLRLELAERHQERERLKRVFKPGFKVKRPG